jgi:hypothetical protein
MQNESTAMGEVFNVYYYEQYWFEKMLARFSLKEYATCSCNLCVAHLKVQFCAYGTEELVNMNSVVGEYYIM